MEKRVERFLPLADRQKIESCIRRAESRTRGEIMVVVEAASGHYPEADLRAASALAFPVAVALTPLLGGLLWAGPFNLWIFLGALAPLFLVIQAAVKRIPLLKRVFISDREMQAQVRDAAEIQFYRKGVFRTREATGVLIYVSVFERKVRVLGDRGINLRIPEGTWAGVAATIAQGVREGRPAESVCRAVGRVADLLAEKFPVAPGDVDELKNLVVEGWQA
jgi:putative membrane protein